MDTVTPMLDANNAMDRTLLPHPYIARRLQVGYRGTSLTRNCTTLGPYSRSMPLALWRPRGGDDFL
jgi:hypothetical protein